jgi:hypothetical protein
MGMGGDWDRQALCDDAVFCDTERERTGAQPPGHVIVAHGIIVRRLAEVDPIRKQLDACPSRPSRGCSTLGSLYWLC